MGVVDRPIRRQPSNLHSPKLLKYLRFCHRSQVFHFTSLPFGLVTAPQIFTMIVKLVKLMALTRGIRLHQYLDDWLIGPSLRKKHNKHSDSGRPNPVLRLDNKSGEVQTKTYSSVFVCGLRLPSRFRPQERWLKFKDLFLRLKSTHVFDYKMFDVANWVVCLSGENGPGGTPSHEALSVSPQGALEISSVIGQSPSLDRNLFSTPRMVAESRKREERHRPSSQDHSIQLFTDTSNEGWGAHLEQTSTKGLLSDRGIRLHINVLELKAISLALQRFKDQC